MSRKTARNQTNPQRGNATPSPPPAATRGPRWSLIFGAGAILLLLVEMLLPERRRRRRSAGATVPRPGATARAAAAVSNDAGPMHIAASVGTPTIGLFGPGEEQIWFPYDSGEGHRALRKDVSCHPCHLDFCNRTGGGYMECMKLLTVDEVTSAVLAALR